MDHLQEICTEDAIEKSEIALFLEGVYRVYGYDFREYAPSSIRRRILRIMEKEHLHTISELQNCVLHDRRCMERFLMEVSVNVTEMFRNPSFFKAFRQEVVPLLSSIPFIRIWHVGCATGEEVYSMAILLQEENLLEKTRIYATDINETVLEKARRGIYSLGLMKAYTENYNRSGGTSFFSDYYSTDNRNAVFSEALRKNVVWGQHNLVTDSSFNEFDVILCRNVLIYFNRQLQDRVHKLLAASLKAGGVLGLGAAESLKFTTCEGQYEELDGKTKLYRKVK